MREDGLVAVPLQGPGWPVVVEGELRRPPDEHILDFLVRQEVIYRTDRFQESPEYLSRPSDPGTIAIVEELPDCDICADRERVPKVARYDGGLVAAGGVWAFTCPDCFHEQGVEYLGMGRGQYLMTREEVPDELWPLLQRAESFWTARLKD